MGREGIELADEAIERMAFTRRAFDEFVAASADRHLYGITTAHHRGARTLLSPADRVAYARRIPPTPASVGPPLPERVVRGIVAARVAGFIAGTAAVRPELARAVAAMLDGPMPSVPARGHGEPGEIGTLRALFGGLEHDVVLEAKEGMALVNGAPTSAAVLADVALAGRGRLEVADEVVALAFYAAGALDAHLDPALDAAWRDPYEAAALDRLRELPAGGRPRPTATRQPVAFRDAPRLLGWQRRLQQWAQECAEISLSAPGDNPMFAPEDADGRRGSSPTPDTTTPAPRRCSMRLRRRRPTWRRWPAVQATRLAEDPAGLAASESEPEVTLLSMTALGWAEEARLAAGAHADLARRQPAQRHVFAGAAGLAVGRRRRCLPAGRPGEPCGAGRAYDRRRRASGPTGLARALRCHARALSAAAAYQRLPGRAGRIADDIERQVHPVGAPTS